MSTFFHLICSRCFLVVLQTWVLFQCFRPYLLRCFPFWWRFLWGWNVTKNKWQPQNNCQAKLFFRGPAGCIPKGLFSWKLSLKPIPLFHTRFSWLFLSTNTLSPTIEQSSGRWVSPKCSFSTSLLEKHYSIWTCSEYVPSSYPMPFSKFPLPRHREENRQLHGRSLQPSFKSQGIQGAGGVLLQLYLEEGGGT